MFRPISLDASRLSLFSVFLLPSFANALTCPPVDNAGNALSTSQASAEGPPLLCTYSGAGLCAYFADGPLDASASTSKTCPDIKGGSGSGSASGPPTSTATPLGFPPPTSIASSTGIERSSAGASATTSFGSTPPTSIASSTGIEGSSTDASASSPSSRIPSAIISAPPDALSQSTSHDARTAAIAGSVIGFAFLVGILFLLLWLIKRRRRIHEGRLPEQYSHAGQRTPPDAWKYPSLSAAREKSGDAASPVSPQTRNAVRLGLEQRKFRGPDVAPNHPSQGREDVGARSGAMDNMMPQEERLNLRIRRMEAQLDAILRLGLPESAPPRYSTEN